MNHRQPICLVPLLFLLSTGASADPAIQQQLFDRVFGTNHARLDPALVTRTLALPKGERLFIPAPAPSHHAELWFIDHSPRHDSHLQPLLVRVIDQDGDLTEGADPDTDSDLYLADWHGNGVLDVVMDYSDTDHDGDVDEMALYFFNARDHFLEEPALRVWWSRDDGDDNRLWESINYTYRQRDCQWLCDFNGDETFVAFGLTTSSEKWLPIWENPFLFYDPDQDQRSEVVIRYQGLGRQIEALRYSFDIDRDTSATRPHDYDFSFSAIAPGSRWEQAGAGSTLLLPKPLCEQTSLRGIPTGSFVRRDQAAAWAEDAPWDRVLLTWDEIDANTNGDWRREPQERWEGVIAHPNDDFPQIGGPTCGPLNKRYEFRKDSSSPLRLYFSSEDHKLHLYGAEKAWLHIDYDLDGEVDLIHSYRDLDRDGFFDHRTLDIDADGRPEYEWPMRAGRQLPDLDPATLQEAYQTPTEDWLTHSQAFIDAAAQHLPPESHPPAQQAFRNLPSLFDPFPELGRHIQSSLPGRRFYLDIQRDQLFHQLTRHHQSLPPQFSSAYGAGRLAKAARILQDLPPGK